MPIPAGSESATSIIDVTDLPASLQAAEMVDLMVAGANAKAARVAPCLVDGETPPTGAQVAEARLILIGAVERWAKAGSGALQSQQAGPFGMTVDTRQRTGFNLWPSEIADLQAICSNGPTGREAFSIDTAPTTSWAHAETCSLNFGANYCDCGAILAGYPIFGQPS